MTKKTIFFLFFTMFFALPLFCQNVAKDTSIVLSLDSCLAMATRNSYDIQIAEQLKIRAKSEKDAVFTMFFPKISATGGVMYMFKDIELLKNIDQILPAFNPSSLPITLPPAVQSAVNQIAEQIRKGIINNWKPIEISLKGAFFAGITVSQPIFAGGRIVNGFKTAKIGNNLAEENYTLKRQETLIEAQKSYWLYVSVREKVKVVKLYENLLEVLEQQIQSVKDAEMINRSDLLKVQVQRNAIKNQLAMAETGLELSKMALCRIVGIGYESDILPSDTNIYITEKGYLLHENTFEDRPEYKLMKNQVALKESQVKNILGQYLPTVGLMGVFGYAGGVKIGSHKENPINVSNLTAVVNIPITGWWEGANKIKAAKTEKSIAELEMRKNTELLQLQIKQVTHNLVNSYNAIKTAELAVEQASESLKISTDRYGVNLETLADLLTAQAAWQTAVNNLLDSKIEYRINEAEYLKAIGKL